MRTTGRESKNKSHVNYTVESEKDVQVRKGRAICHYAHKIYPRP